MSLDTSFGSYLSQLEQQYQLPNGLLATQMKTESNGDVSAQSSKGALGLFQFMPETAKQYGIDPLDPNQAALGAAKMNADLLSKYNGDLPSALAAYNWGQGNVDRKGLENAPEETKNYIQKIMDGIGETGKSALSSIGNLIIPSAQAEEMPSYINSSPKEQVVQDVKEEVGNPYAKMSNEELMAEAQKQGIIQQNNNSVDQIMAQAKPWSSDSVQSATIQDYSKMSNEQLLAEAQKQGLIKAPPSALEDVGNTLVGNVLPNLPLSALGALSYPLEYMHRGADYLARHAANGVRGLMGLPDSQLPYEPAVATPAQMTSDIADYLGKPLYQPQTALGRMTANIGNMAVPSLMTGGLASIAPIVGGTVAAEGANQLGGGEEAQYLASLAGGGLGAKISGIPAEMDGKNAPMLEIGGEVVGEERATQPSPVAPVQTEVPKNAAEQEILANATYKKSDELGGTLTPQGTNKLMSIFAGEEPKTPAEEVAAKDDPLKQFYNKWSKVVDKPMSLADAQLIDKDLQTTIDNSYNGFKATTETKDLMQARSDFRQALANPKEGDMVGGNAGFQAWRDAQFQWAQLSKMREIESMIRVAEDAKNYNSSIDSQVRALLKNNKKTKWYSPEEIAAIRQIKSTGGKEYALSLLGSGINKYVAGLIGSSGGPLGAVAGYAAAEGLSKLSNNALQKIKGQKAQNAVQTIANRKRK